MDDRAVNLLSSLCLGKTLVTLAPETVAPDLIAELTARGVIVSAGHTLATSEDMDRAISEGLQAITHLFNAMPPLASRTPGVGRHTSELQSLMRISYAVFCLTTNKTTTNNIYTPTS